MKRLLFVGTYDKPATGQQVCFSDLIDSIDDCIVVSTNPIKNKYLNSVYVLLWLSVQLFVVRPSNIYLTGSRSSVGLLKELPVYIYCRLNRSVRLVNHIHGSDLGQIENTMFFRLLIKPTVKHWIFLHETLIPPSLSDNASVVENYMKPISYTIGKKKTLFYGCQI